jgi:PAS domain S-box-containing protein
MDARDQIDPSLEPVVELTDGEVAAVVLAPLGSTDGHGGVDPGLDDSLERAAQTASDLHRALGQVLPVWVPVDGHEQLDRWPTQMPELLDRHRLPASALVVVVTERMAAEDPERTATALRAMRALGVVSALDRFGSTADALRLLRLLPVSQVTVDVDLLDGPAVLEAVVELAHTVGVVVTVVGVDRIEALLDLRRLGVDCVQGPLLCAADRTALAQPWCGLELPAAEDALAAPAARVLGGGGPRAKFLRALLEVVSDAVIVTDAVADPRRNRIVHVNPGFTAQTGFTASDIIGRSPIALDPPQVNRDRLEELFEAMGAGRGADVETQARRRDGTTFPCGVRLTPVRDNAGAVTHWVQVRRDLSQNRAVERERSWFQWLVERGDRGTLLVDDHGFVLYANQAMADLAGVDPLDLVGRTVGDLLPVDALDPTADPETGWELLPIRPGPSIPVTVERRALDIDGLEGVRAVLCDDLRPRLRRRALAGLAGEFAAETLRFDLVSSEWTERLAELLRSVVEALELDRAEVVLLDDARMELVPLVDHDRACGGPRPDPTPTAYRAVRLWLKAVRQGQAMYLRGDESDRPSWWRERAPGSEVGPLAARADLPLRAGEQLLGVLTVELDAPGRVRAWDDDERRLLGHLGETIAQLLLRVRSVRAVVAREAELSAVLASVTDVLFVVDREWRLRFVSRAARALGFVPAELAGAPMATLVHPEDFGFLCDLLSGADAAAGTVSVRVRLLTADDSWRWFEANLGEARTGDGWLVACRDIDDKVLEEAEATYRAVLDTLVMESAQQVVSYGASGFVAQLDAFVARLGEAMAVDRVWIDMVEEDGETVRRMVAWSAPDLPTVPPADPPAEPVSIQADSAWMSYLQEQSPVVVADADLDDGYREARVGLPEPSPRSLVCVTILLKDVFGGTLGVGHDHDAREWTTTEVNAVQTLGGIVSAALATHKLDLALRENEAKFRRLSDQATELVATLAPDGVITYVSASVETILGWPAFQLVGTGITQLIHPSEHDKANRLLSGIVWSAKAVEQLRLRHADGSYRWLACTFSALKDRVGRLLEVRILADEVRDPGERFLTVDPETNLPDRVEIERQIELLGAEAGVGVIVVDVEVADIDDVGAEVLRPIAERVTGRLRGTDILGRVGPNTLAVVCPRADGAGLGVLSGRLVEWVAEHVLTTHATVAPVPILGAVAGGAGTSGRVMLMAAERAAAKARETGQVALVRF